jgi:DNA segregation ATPase FtsK/SpoIIIE, S-DNA-T family
MARVRRRGASRRGLNLEIVGIVALGLAVLFAVSLVLPRGVGAFGGVAKLLEHLLGAAAPFFPLLIAVLGGIVFLEINVPRTMASFGSSAIAYFLVIDAALGSHGARGGVIGATMFGALRALVGTTGAWIVLVVVALALTLSVTNVSLKKIIGWIILTASRVRIPRVRLPKIQVPEMKLPHANLREAFSLPARSERKTAVATAETAPAVFDDEVEEIEEEEPDEDEFDEEELDEEEADDEGADDEEELESDEEPEGTAKPPAVVERRAPTYARDDTIVGYALPDLSILDVPPAKARDDADRAHILEDTLASFGVGAKVIHVERGPSVTRYELRPERGVKISRIAALADDLALALAATSVRIEAPIPGKSAVGIEVPNQTVSVVSLREILEALPNRGQVPPLWMALGKDITGRPVFGDLGKMPHLLVAGATGAGKSVCLNAIILSLLVSATPDQVQMLMIDPKRVELPIYNGIPHLIKDVITDPRLAAGALLEMIKEMESRYERFAKASVRKIEEYNAKYPEEKLPYVVIVIDELADLMLVAPAKVETAIMRLAQLARATGIHLIVATQRPSADVITGLIKANIPSRIAFAVSSQVDSRVIIDMNGAERLLGRGDMLYLPIDAPKPIRAQGALVTSGEVHRVVDFWARQARPENLLDVDVVAISDDDDRARKEMDPLWYDAGRFIVETQYASTAQLQSRFSIGHPRAVRIMKQLEDVGVVGPHEGTKARKIIMGYAEIEQVATRVGKGDSGQQDLFTLSS